MNVARPGFEHRCSQLPLEGRQISRNNVIIFKNLFLKKGS